MKKIKLLALLGIAFFATSAINAQVSFGLNVGLPTVVVSGHYERAYAPQRVYKEHHRNDRVYGNSGRYENRRDYDRRRYEAQRRYEPHRRYEAQQRYEAQIRYEERDNHGHCDNDEYDY